MTSRCAAWRLSICFIASLAIFHGNADAKTCVWKITSPSGGVLYLGGTLHRLRSTEYPLPPSYNRAFDLSQRIAFEETPGTVNSVDQLEKLAIYPKGDELKNHVDPRTYEYILKVFGRAGIPADKLARYRPWFLVFLLSSGGSGRGPGVESYFTGRAKHYNWPIEGLESNRDHLQVFSGLTDRQGEAFLLLTFIQAKSGSKDDSSKVSAAWRSGDPEFLERLTRTEYRDFPAMADRLLTVRNQAWIPKIENWLRSGKTYFVLAGAAHMGGSNGLIALLRARGYQIEQW
jgi:uncharacterized protein YbaP (TraB family)